jgi:D-alanyl-D-alanine carboxypeptidase
METALQQTLDEALKAGQGVGVSAALIIPGRDVWLGTSGVSERAPAKALDPRMVFQMASIKKNLIAALILQLADEKRLSLDAPIGKWLPTYEHISPDITVRQLLNHTSGVFDYVEHPDSLARRPLSSLDLNKHWTPEEIITTLVGEPYFASGAGWHYSSTNYLLLQLIAARVTGSDVDEELRARFFEPLGLTSVFAVPGESVPPGFEIAHAWHDLDGDGTLDDLTAQPNAAICSWAGGELYCTPEDLARWLVHLIEGDVLTPDSRQQMLSFHSPTPGEDWMNGYGLGIAKNEINGIRWWGHAGWIFGYKCGVIYLPDFNICLAVMSNDNSPTSEVAAQTLLQTVLTQLGGAGP